MVTLQCSVSAYPQVSLVTWHKDGVVLNLTGRTDQKYAGGTPDTPSLTIRSLTKDDAGHYTCEATNRVGATLGDVITLDVTCEFCYYVTFASFRFLLFRFPASFL